MAKRSTRRARKPKPPGRTLAGSTKFRDFVLDQLSELGNVTARAMFGGVGLYCGDLFFGLIARDELYLKVDDTNRRDYQDAGMHAFRPYPDRPGTMKYYQVPAGVLESAPDLVRWAKKAVAVARNASG